MQLSLTLPVLGLAITGTLAQTINKQAVAALAVPTYSIATTATAQTVTYNAASAYASVAAAVQSNGVQQKKRDAASTPSGGWPQCPSCTATTSQAPAPTGPPPPPCTNCGNCAPQPLGSGPVPSPDTPAAFSADTDFSNAALSAPVPEGYSQTFQNLNASNNAYQYMGFTNLPAYDSNDCANRCNAIDGCMAFNIYFERDPTLDAGIGCDNPPSTTNIKCVFWGGPVADWNANNYGQTRANFSVIIAGSNGYVNNTIPTCDGWTPGQNDHDAAINAPLDCNGQVDTYLGFKLFQGVPYDVELCKTACESQNVYNTQHPAADGSVKTCQFFNTYILLKNGVAVGQYCSMYTRAWDISYATNTGYSYGSDVYTIKNSFSYSNTTMSGQVCPAAKPSTSKAAPSSTSTTSTMSTFSTISTVSTSTKSSTTVITSSTTTSCTTTKTTTTPVTTPKTTVAPTTTAAPTTTTKATTTSTKSTSTTCTCAAATPKPQAPYGKQCGVQGYCGSQTPFKVQSGSSCPNRDICGWNCKNSASCNSFAWNEDKKTCHLFQGAVDSWAWMWSWTFQFSGFVVYDDTCYQDDWSPVGSAQCAAPAYQPQVPAPLPKGKGYSRGCQWDSDCSCGRCINFWGLGGICQ